ncbi:MAG: hypothetical protein EAZ53_11435 [Bacteroidetes bacterium]|nr:MAG: hypothetical protein EAZ53_11435 [Bacteroidota bacterium]
MKSTLNCLILFGLLQFGCAKKSFNSKIRTHSDENSSETNYRFKVSLFSKGSGIDGKAKIDLEKFIDLETKESVVVYKRSWGREGEIDYCFEMSKLTASNQTTYIEKLKNRLLTSKNVNYNENCACK